MTSSNSYASRPVPRLDRGFTLIELLVVIAIISILAALLIPALREARDSGIKSGCLVRMRSWGTAVYSYSVDHNSQFPLYAWTLPDGKTHEADVWINTLSAYLGGETILRTETRAVQVAKSEKNRSMEIRQCPSGKAFVGCHYNNPFRWLGLMSHDRLDFSQIRKPGGMS